MRLAHRVAFSCMCSRSQSLSEVQRSPSQNAPEILVAIPPWQASFATLNGLGLANPFGAPLITIAIAAKPIITLVLPAVYEQPE